METAEKYVKEMYEKAALKDIHFIPFEEAKLQPEYKIFIETIQQVQKDTIRAMETECKNHVKINYRYIRVMEETVPEINKNSISECAERLIKDIKDK